jgi:hypothetical protein
MPIPLTSPEQRDLESRELLAEGLSRAVSSGYLDEDGTLEVVPVVGTVPFEVHEVEALCWLSSGELGSVGGGVLGADDCRRMTESLAEGRARIVGRLHNVPGYTHAVELTHNLDDTLLPFSVIYHARLR